MESFLRGDTVNFDFEKLKGGQLGRTTEDILTNNNIIKFIYVHGYLHKIQDGKANTSVESEESI